MGIEGYKNILSDMILRGCFSGYCCLFLDLGALDFIRTKANAPKIPKIANVPIIDITTLLLADRFNSHVPMFA